MPPPNPPNSAESHLRPPKTTTESQRAGKWHVLSPSAAKARFSKPYPGEPKRAPPLPSQIQPNLPSTTSTSSNTSNGPRLEFQDRYSSKSPFAPSSTSSSSSSSSRRWSIFSSSFRTRFASLPRPVRTTFRVLRFLAPMVPIGIFFAEHVVQVMWVRGPSMTPYLNEDYETMHTKGDMVLVNMWPWGRGGGGGGGGWPWERQRWLERGMVVTFRSPANPSHIAIKRVVGLPGDRITTREPCLKPTQIVPYNHVWLEGDAADPRKSLDSNTYGPVSISLITGRVMAVLWPRMRMLKWSDWEKDTAYDDHLGKAYRRDTRQRVLKGAVKLEQPFLE